MSRSIYPPESFTPPVWGVFLDEYTGPDGNPCIQLTIQGNEGTGYVRADLSQMAELVNQLRLVMIALKIYGKEFEGSATIRKTLIELMGGIVPEGQ